MINKILIIFLVLSTYSLGGQKYFVFFKNKPISSTSSLFKSSSLYLDALNSLSDNAIERRKKALGENFIDEMDIRVNEEYISILKNSGAEIKRKLNWFNAISCLINDDATLLKIKSLPFVESIRPVGIIKYSRPSLSADESNFLSKSNDGNLLDYGNSLTQVELSDIPILHNYGITGNGVLIGMLDAGFKYDTHPAFSRMKIIDKYDFVYDDPDVSNDNDVSHGTAVLSIIGGYAEGFLIGPAYDAEYILSKTEYISAELNVEEDNFAAAVEWMEAEGVDIMSCSLGYSDFDSGQNSYQYKDMNGKTTIVTRAYEIAFQKGVVTVTSAGNEGASTWHYITAPADGIHVITAGSVNSANEVASSSSRGPTYDGRIKPDVMAMGVSDFHANAGSDDYSTGSGTSFAAPLVSGMCAQLLSAYPHLSNNQVRSIILESGDNAATPDNDRGYGLLSAQKAVEFPNLQLEQNSYLINKILFPQLLSSDPSVQIHFTINNEDENISDLNSTDGLKYTFDMPQASKGDTVQFYYTYLGQDGSSVRIPSNKNYRFSYGDLIVNLSSKEEEPVPSGFKLIQNYPNPFNSFTSIDFELPEKSHVVIRIYDVLGRQIKTLVDDTFNEGFYYGLKWNGTNSAGYTVSSGTYFCSMTSKSKSSSIKLIFLK